MKPTGARVGPPDCEHKERPIYATRLCASCYTTAYKKAHPEKYRAYWKTYHQAHRPTILERQKTNNIRHRYGLTKDDVAQMARQQGYTCAICQRLFTAQIRPHIDHNHSTNEIRGLLCGQCSHGLGSFRDNPAVLRAAALYLEL